MCLFRNAKKRCFFPGKGKAEDFVTTGSALQNTRINTGWAEHTRCTRARHTIHKRRVQARNRWAQADKHGKKIKKTNLVFFVCKPVP
jgi:hypothetical protein